MKESIASEPEQPAEHETVDFVRRNALTEAAADLLADEELWGEHKVYSHMSTPGRSQYSLRPIQYRTHQDTGEETRTLRPTAALVLVYGDKLVSRPNDSPAMSICDLVTLTAVHQRIKAALGENGRIARLVIPPDPLKVAEPNRWNTDAWLAHIARGMWPIMLESDGLGGLEPLAHDEDSSHLGNMVLYPRVTQDLITDVAIAELQRRAAHPRRISVPAVPSHPASFRYAANDPYASTVYDKRYRDGADMIDLATNSPDYLMVLGHLVSAPGLGQLQQYFESLVNPPHGASEHLEGLHFNFYNAARQIVHLANCRVRMLEDRNLTRDEAAAYQREFVRGTLRVAQKIRGEWPGQTAA